MTITTKQLQVLRAIKEGRIQAVLSRYKMSFYTNQDVSVTAVALALIRAGLIDTVYSSGVCAAIHVTEAGDEVLTAGERTS